MSEYRYRIRLTSDAQPATGLGGETVNSFVPRDAQGRLIIPASHIKGLIREVLSQMVNQLNWHPAWVDALLGKPDTQGLSRFNLRIGDAFAESDVKPYRVTRTAIDASGTAKGASLRTNELIPVGTIFEGAIHAAAGFGNDPAASILEELWKLLLLSIPAVGGNRTRGCGECVVELLEQKFVLPESLLRMHDVLIAPPAAVTDSQLKPSLPVLAAADSQADEEIVFFDLVFVADSPVCCPEKADKTNMLQSGFAIPASAIQGAILHRLRAFDTELADHVYASPGFRAWPLLPAALDCTDDLPWPVRVSLTHRAAKYALGEAYGEKHFQDAAIAAYRWEDVPRGAPLKAYDGVLLTEASGTVSLWKASAMPRVVTAHGVHRDPNTETGRNLFTVDSMAPMVWRGLLAVPKSYATKVWLAVQQDPAFAFGKSRTVRGCGALSIKEVDNPPHFSSGKTGENDILVVQSPLFIPDDLPLTTAEEALKTLVTQWAMLHSLALPAIGECWATTSIQFGWNRFTDLGRLKACRVIDPESTVRLDGALPEHARKKLAVGIGAGRERGFGAVALHPGRANKMFVPPGSETIKEGPARLKEAVHLVLQTAQRLSRWPSVSQIRELQQRVEHDSQKIAAEYFVRQLVGRDLHLAAVWSPLRSLVESLLDPQQFNQQIASRALTLLAHCAADQREQSMQRTGNH